MRKISYEVDEVKRFINFLDGSGRLADLEYVDKTSKGRGPDCIHVIQDFAATATRDHVRKTSHLNKLDADYKGYREHALNCRRCQVSLDAIFAFTAYENKVLFTGSDTQKILQLEHDVNLDNGLYLGKLLPGYSKDELTYITSLPLSQAVSQFRKTVQEPLDLINFSEPMFKKKKANNGKGWGYVQAYMYPIDKRHKTKISIRSLKR